MTDNKHKVHTDALETLGTVIDETAARDAIHLAVEPVVAGERLFPGQDVGLAADGAATTKGKLVGIVDPFLKAPVMPGERFWLVVYPRQITSLRHVWEHPDFNSVVATVPTDSRDEDKAYSEKWMRKWAKKHTSYDYYGEDENLSDEAAYQFAVEAGRKEHIGPYESAREYIDDEWWGHWENITGERGKRGSYFSCSC